MIDKINCSNKINNINFKAEAKTTQTQTAGEVKDDNKIKLAKLTGQVFCAALVAAGGIALASKAIGKSGNKISSLDIKKGEISDELFYFLKRFKKGDAFTQNLQKEEVLKLNGLLNETNFSQFKKLAKQSNLDPSEITQIVENLNEHNTPLLDKIILKLENEQASLKPEKGEIAAIIKNINEKNKEFAPQLIDSAKTTYNMQTNAKTRGAQSLIDILDFVDDKNKDAFRSALSFRKEGTVSKFSFNEIKELTELIQKHNCPLSSELFANLKSANGVDYRLNFENLKETIKKADDEYIDLYHKFFNEKSERITEYIPALKPGNEKILNFIEQDARNYNLNFFSYHQDCIDGIEKHKDFMEFLIDKYSQSPDFKAEDLRGFLSKLETEDKTELMEKIKKLPDTYKSCGYIFV